MKVGLAIQTLDLEEWIALALASIPDTETLLLNSQERYLPDAMEVLDILIVDGDNPGPFFLSAVRQFGLGRRRFPVIILGASSSPVLLHLDWKVRDLSFISKPYRIEDLKNFVEQKLQQLRDAERKEEAKMKDDLSTSEKSKSAGQMPALNLFDLVQMLSLNNWTGKIEVDAIEATAQGEVFLQGGLVTHALCGSLMAYEALYCMLGWKRCEFSFFEANEAEFLSINEPWEKVLMEGARHLDVSRDEDPFMPRASSVSNSF